MNVARSLLCSSLLLVAACTHVRAERCAAPQRLPPTDRASDSPLEPELIEDVALGEHGEILILLSPGVVRVDGHTAVGFRACHPFSSPLVFFPVSEDAAWIGGGVCELATGRAVERNADAEYAVAQPGELVAGFSLGSELRVIQPYSERTIRFPVEVHRAVLGHGAALVLDHHPMWIANLDEEAPPIRVTVPTDPNARNAPWIQRAQWRGESILLIGEGDHQFMVFRVDGSLTEPTVWIRHTRLRIPVAALSPDGERVVSAVSRGRIACHDTRTGAEIWRTWNYYDGTVRELRWAPDGLSVVARHDHRIERIYVPTGDSFSSEAIDPRSTVAISPDGTTTAECRPGLPGEDARLFLRPLQYRDVRLLYEAVTPPGDRARTRVSRRTWNEPDRRVVTLPAQSCAQAQVRWLDHGAIAVFNNRLHLIRDDQTVLSVGVEAARLEGVERWRIQRDHRAPEPLPTIGTSRWAPRFLPAGP